MLKTELRDFLRWYLHPNTFNDDKINNIIERYSLVKSLDSERSNEARTLVLNEDLKEHCPQCGNTLIAKSNDLTWHKCIHCAYKWAIASSSDPSMGH